MTRLQGRVLSVEATPQGSSAVSWTGNTLLVVDASDFVREGGQFSIDSGIYDYVSVVEGDLDTDPDIVTTVQSSPGGFVDEFRVDIYPPAVDVVAEVALQESADSIPVTVPPELHTLLPVGVRDVDAGESVELVQVGQRWQVADVLGLVYGDSSTVPLDVPGVVVTDNEGGTLAELDGAGGLSVQSLNSAGDVTMSGWSLTSLISSQPRFIRNFPAPNCLDNAAGSEECGQFDVSFNVTPGHVHAVEFDGYVNAPANTRFQLNLRAVSAAVEGADATTPTIANSVLWATGMFSSGSTGGPQRVRVSHVFTTNYSIPVEHRVLVTLQNLTDNSPVNVANSGSSGVLVRTLGIPGDDGAMNGDANLNSGGVTPVGVGGVTTPTTVRRTYTTTWRASAVKGWHLGVGATSPLYSGNYGGDQRSSWILFGQGAVSSTSSSEVGKTLQQALGGSTNLSGSYTLTCTRTYASAGATVKVSWHAITSTPTSQPGAGSNPVSSLWKLGKGTRAIPTAELSRLATGASRGIILGDTSGQANNSSYAQHSAALSDITLTIQYTR